VQHHLYHSFIKEKYNYLLDRIEEDDVEGCFGIPHMPLPTCVPNKDDRKLLDFGDQLNVEVGTKNMTGLNI